ncbi:MULTISPECIES: hypothetical protein [Anaeromyxobacter]|uniref:hypothetical protein n=1 Tax=Anaeromyxobacter TaxID=161492 RepID=UPI001F59332D|nr:MULTISPECIES: hypothetical protein [unclassified Anaeromyxobacter]
MSHSAFPRATRAALVLCVAVATLSGCATVRQALSPAPRGVPSGRDGWLVYSVHALRFEAPAAWGASGGEQHLTLEAPDGSARMEISTPGTSYADEQACLAGAEEFLKRGAALERVRRHPTRLAGVSAVTLEGDSGGWHVWAYAACDGGTQYQLFFTARSPAAAEAVEAYRTLVQSAKIGGQA